MRANYLKSLLIAAATAGLATGVQAQIPYLATGTATYDFATTPTAADGWTTGSIAGGAGDVTTEAAMDTAVAAVVATGITAAFPVSATFPPNGTAGTWRHNTSPSGLFLQSNPTGVRATVLMATLRNDSGGNVSTISVNYDFGNPYVVAGEQLPGVYAYYSLSGLADSWVKVPELSGATLGAKSVILNLSGGPWASGQSLYIIWVDDNGSPSPENTFSIDNFQVGTGVAAPPTIVTQPANTTVPERNVATLTVAATGTSLTYQWYRGTPASPTAIPGATTTALRVTNMTGLVRYPWSTPLDNGNYFVRVSGAGGAPVDSSVAAVTVTPDTTAPALRYVECGFNTTLAADQFTLNLSEPLNNAGGEVTDASNWEIRSLDNASGLGIVNITYVDNGTSTTVLFDLDAGTPRDATKGYKLTLVNGAALTDTATTPNSLVGPKSASALCFTNVMLNFTAAWKYNDKDVDPGPTWATVAYDDSVAPWVSGPGPFDAKRNGGGAAGANCRDVALSGLGPVGTCINLTSPVTATNLITAYFRTHFNFSGNPSNAVLLLNGKFDDGAVFYLNGTEIWRLGMAAGAVTHTTLATRTVGDGDAQDVLTLPAPAGLINGDNLIAYSLHQVNLTSSDLYGGLQISQLAPEPAAAAPVLTITQSGTSVNIRSTVAGTLISSADVRAARSGWTSEGAIGVGAPGVTLPTSARKFFSVRVP